MPPLAVPSISWRPPASAQDQLKAAGWNTSLPGYGNPLPDVQHAESAFDKPEVRRAFVKAADKQKLISSHWVTARC